MTINLTKIEDIPFIEGFYYLACPYGHRNAFVTAERVTLYEQIDGKLMSVGLWTFSPLDKHYKLGYTKLPGTYEYWKGYCKCMMDLAAGLIVITLDGWETAPGVQDEIRMAKERGIPIYYV
jgi:hypothetical protein